jgi:hypothetical protein
MRHFISARRVTDHRGTVEPECWIAACAFVGFGVWFGRGAVVGACVVLLSDVQAGSIVAVVPARMVGARKCKTGSRTLQFQATITDGSAKLDLPRFRGGLRAWDQGIWFDVMLSVSVMVGPPAILSADPG